MKDTTAQYEKAIDDFVIYTNTHLRSFQNRLGVNITKPVSDHDALTKGFKLAYYDDEPSGGWNILFSKTISIADEGVFKAVLYEYKKEKRIALYRVERDSQYYFGLFSLNYEIATDFKRKYSKAIMQIGIDIEALKDSFPQLANFTAAANVDTVQFIISYEYKTHIATHWRGWTSGVPNPDDDGIWFYIDFHDPGSTAQIHTQPASFPFCIGGMQVAYLILQGKATKSIGSHLQRIMKKCGVKACTQDKHIHYTKMPGCIAFYGNTFVIIDG